MDSIGAGLLSSERVVFGMSLGRKYSMYGSFKGAPERNFVGFTQLPNLTVCARPPTLDDHNFLIRAPFWVLFGSMKIPLSIESIHIYLDKI